MLPLKGPRGSLSHQASSNSEPRDPASERRPTPGRPPRSTRPRAGPQGLPNPGRRQALMPQTPTSARSARRWPKFAKLPQSWFGRARPDFGRLRHNFGQIRWRWPEFGRSRLQFGRHGPWPEADGSRPHVGRTRPGFGRNRRCGQIVFEFDRGWLATLAPPIQSNFQGVLRNSVSSWGKFPKGVPKKLPGNFPRALGKFGGSLKDIWKLLHKFRNKLENADTTTCFNMFAELLQVSTIRETRRELARQLLEGRRKLPTPLGTFPGDAFAPPCRERAPNLSKFRSIR